MDASSAAVPADAPAAVGSSFMYRGRTVQAEAAMAKPSVRANAGIRPFRSRNDIDDPLWNHDHLARRPALQRLPDEIEVERGPFDGTLICVACNCQIASFLAVDLHRQGDFV